MFSASVQRYGSGVCSSLLAVLIYPCMSAFLASFVALYFSPCARGCGCLTCLVAMHSVLSQCVTVTFKDQTAKDKALQHMAAMSSAQIVSATAIHNKLGLPGIPRPTFPGAPGVSQEPGLGMRAALDAGWAWACLESSSWHFLPIGSDIKRIKTTWW